MQNRWENLKCEVQDNHVITTDVTLSSSARLVPLIVPKGVLVQSGWGHTSQRTLEPRDPRHQRGHPKAPTPVPARGGSEKTAPSSHIPKRDSQILSYPAVDVDCPDKGNHLEDV